MTSETPHVEVQRKLEVLGKIYTANDGTTGLKIDDSIASLYDEWKNTSERAVSGSKIIEQ